MAVTRFKANGEMGFPDQATPERFNQLVDEANNEISILNGVVDLFAMGGQSNMQGQSEGMPTAFELPKYKAYEYKLLTNTLTTVKHPFGEDIGTLLLGAHQGWGSLSPRFAEGYLKSTGIPPLMVGVAKGATTVEQWQKTGADSARYAKLVEKVNGASVCAANSNLIVRHKCFVWLQGESDGIANTAKYQYKQKFLTLWNDLKNDCGFTKCFIIRVSKFYAHNVPPIIKAQEELANEYEDIIMTTRITGNFTVANNLMQSIWHYTNAGYDLAGSVAGKAVGMYLNQQVIPKLETEPYTELSNALEGKYEFNYRTGTIAEVTSKISTTIIGAPSIQPTFFSNNFDAGIKLGNDITLDDAATISFTGLFITPLGTGSILTSYDGVVSDLDFIFFYFSNFMINVAGAPNVTGQFFNTAEIMTKVSTYNHYVIHKVGKTYSLYFNNKLVQTIFNGPSVLNINTLFYGVGLGLKGRVKHMMINKGAIIAPKSCDALFYSNAEEGTI